MTNSSNLSNNKSYDETISDKKLKSALDYAISTSRKETSYKFVFLQAILDNLDKVDSNLILSFDIIFTSFTEFYWILVRKYKLKQSKYDPDVKQTTVESIFNEYAKTYKIDQDVPFSSLNSQIRDDIIKQIKTNCKSSVVEALNNSTNGLFYTYSLKEEWIKLEGNMYDFLSRNQLEIKHLNFREMVKYLYDVNDVNLVIRFLYEAGKMDYLEEDMENMEDQEDLNNNPENIPSKTIPTLNLLNNNKALLANIEKSNDIIQEIHDDQTALHKELNDLKNTLKVTTNEKNSYITKQKVNLKKLERNNRVLITKKQSLLNDLNKINSDFNNYKIDKSDEISSLNKEIESLKEEIENLNEEREKDKKVLAEFENVIKVLDKIKGIFSKD